MTEEQKQLFEADPLIKLLKEKKIVSLSLVGGAVVDILEGRTPKDYDFIAFSEICAEKLGVTYLRDTKTATTYQKDDIIIQNLKTSVDDFDFKISQTKLSFDYKGEMVLHLHKNSFDNKLLIPCESAWTERKNALNSLKRIVHWRNKGYTIADETYMSLLNVVGKSRGEKS